MLIARIPLCCGVIIVFKNGKEPSGHVSSIVNLMVLLILLMYLRKFSLCSVHCFTNVSYRNLFQSLGGFSAVLRAFFSKCSMDAMAAFFTCS